MEVIEHMAKLVGYANAEGTFNPGRKVFTQNDCGCPTVRWSLPNVTRPLARAQRSHERFCEH